MLADLQLHALQIPRRPPCTPLNTPTPTGFCPVLASAEAAGWAASLELAELGFESCCCSFLARVFLSCVAPLPPGTASAHRRGCCQTGLPAPPQTCFSRHPPPRFPSEPTRSPASP